MNKKTTAIVAGVLCIVSIASAQTVVSGTFGFAKVDKPAGELNLLGNNFEDTTLNEFAPADLYNGDIAAGNSDTIYIWNASGGYQIYALYDERPYSGSKVEWRDFNDFAGAAVNPDIPSGSSLWLDAVGTATDTNIVISGTVVDVQSTTNTVSVGIQQLSYSFTMNIDLNETLLANGATGDIAASNADKIYVWDSQQQEYVIYALYDERPYSGPTVEWRYFNDFTRSASNTTVNLGSGFWYEAINEFDWIETNKYYGNL